MTRFPIFKSKCSGKPELDRVFAKLDNYYNSTNENLGDVQLAAGLCEEFGISFCQALPYVEFWRAQ